MRLRSFSFATLEDVSPVALLVLESSPGLNEVWTLVEMFHSAPGEGAEGQKHVLPPPPTDDNGTQQVTEPPSVWTQAGKPEDIRLTSSPF